MYEHFEAAFPEVKDDDSETLSLEFPIARKPSSGAGSMEVKKPRLSADLDESEVLEHKMSTVLLDEDSQMLCDDKE